VSHSLGCVLNVELKQNSVVSDLLARAPLQAPSDPYYQSTCLAVCVSATFDAKYLGN